MWDPDITGFYESVPLKPGEHSAILLQLNQVGNILVGWFTAPPYFVGNPSDIKSLPPPENKGWMPTGVLVAVLNTPPDRKIDFSWIKAKQPAYGKNDDPLSRYFLDPIDILFGSGQGESYGSLLPNNVSGVCVDLQIAFDMTRVKGDFAKSPFVDRLMRISQSPRISNHMSAWLSEELRKSLLVEQFCPMPMSFVDKISKKIVPDDNPKSIPKVAEYFKKWRLSSNKQVKKIMRENIANELSAASLVPEKETQYRMALQARLQAYMASYSLVIGEEKKTYLDWYRAVLAEEMDILEQNKQLGKTSEAKSFIVDNFRTAGITSTGHYAYTLSFGELPLFGLEKLLEKSRQLSRAAKYAGHVGLLGFKVTIKKEYLYFEKDNHGQIKYQDGKPVVKQRVFLWDSKGMDTGIFAGVFGDLGVGLSLMLGGKQFSNKSGIPMKGIKAELKETSNRSGDLGDIEFTSNISINSPEEFEYARFTVAAVRTPEAALGNFISGSLFDSKFIEIRLQNNVVLSTVQEHALDLSPPSIPKLKTLLEPKKYWEGWTKAKLGLRLFDISMGWGLLLGLEGVIAGIHNIPMQRIHEGNKTTQPRTTAESFFRVDSADIDKSNDLFIFGKINTPRLILEVSLATERSIYTQGRAQVNIRGYASPEHNEKHNLDLSQRRAEAVVQAIKDAFGPLLATDQIFAKGLGEGPAIQSGLKNPPDPVGNWQISHPDQVKQWPEWRRVTLEVDGILMISMRDKWS